MNGLRLAMEQKLYFRNLVLWNQATDRRPEEPLRGQARPLEKCRMVTSESDH
jgi:hypothetical protein